MFRLGQKGFHLTKTESSGTASDKTAWSNTARELELGYPKKMQAFSRLNMKFKLQSQYHYIAHIIN